MIKFFATSFQYNPFLVSLHEMLSCGVTTIYYHSSFNTFSFATKIRFKVTFSFIGVTLRLFNSITIPIIQFRDATKILPGMQRTMFNINIACRWHCISYSILILARVKDQKLNAFIIPYFDKCFDACGPHVWRCCFIVSYFINYA